MNTTGPSFRHLFLGSKLFRFVKLVRCKANKCVGLCQAHFIPFKAKQNIRMK